MRIPADEPACRRTILDSLCFAAAYPLAVHRAALPVVALVALAAWPLNSPAQSGPAADAAAVRLSPVEVLESPLASEPQADAFAEAVTTINADQLRQMNALDFASALRRAPGVTITRFNQIGAFGGDAGGAVFIRGLGTSRPGGEIKMLIDGVPVFNGIFNHPLLDLLSVDTAARIDVHARATPLEAGNTFASVAITTPRRESPGTEVRANAAAGSFGTVSEGLDLGARRGAFDGYFTESIKQSDGARPDSGGRLENYLARVGWTWSPDWDLSYVVNHTENRATDPGILGAPPGPPSTRGETYSTRDWLHLATLSHRFAGATGSIRGYFNEGEGDWIRRQYSGNADSLNHWRLYGVRGRETVQPWEGGELIAGFDLDYEEGRSRSVPPDPAPSSDFGPLTLRLLSLYAGASQRVALDQGWALTPSIGLRDYSHSVFARAWAPQAGLVAESATTQLHVGFSRAVNYPGLETAVFSQLFIPALGLSWRTLRPELANQLEAGIRQRLSPRSTVGFTVFRNDARDRYVIVFPPPPPPRYANLGSYRTEGVELSADTAPEEALRVFASVALLRSTPGDVPYAPRSTQAGGINWLLTPVWLLTADASYVSAMHEATEARVAGASNPTVVGAHFLLNARLARRFLLGGERRTRLEVYLAGENLSDRRFAYQPGYPIPGINLLVGVRLER